MVGKVIDLNLKLARFASRLI